MSVYQQDAIRVLQEEPDFKDAYFHLVEARHKELEALGIADKAQRNAMIAQEEKGLVAQALKAKKSPAQIIYQLAQTGSCSESSSVTHGNLLTTRGVGGVCGPPSANCVLQA